MKSVSAGKKEYVILLTTNSLVFKNINVNGQLLLWKNLHILNESKLNLIDPDFYRSPLNYLRFLAINYLKRKKKTIKGITVWAVDEWAQNYYHWLVEALPKVISTRLPFHSITVVLPSAYKNSRFHEDTLRLLDIKFEYFDSKQERVFCECLYLPLNVAINGTTNPVYIQKLRKLLLDTVPRSSKKSKRIYVSRRLADKRKVVNEGELIALLSAYDFSIVDFENNSFPEQMQICAEAELLLGLHGAGLTNIIFMEPGSTVIEFRSKTDNNFCYNHLANALNLNYLYLASENLDEDLHTSDFLIDLDKLNEQLSVVVKVK